MSEFGCVLLVVVIFGAFLALYVWARLRGERADINRRLQHGEEIHRVFRHVTTGRREQALERVSALIPGARVGYVDSLEQWFTSVSPVLTLLLRDPATSTLVEWYFECFEFPPGKARELLIWLESHLRERTGLPLELLLRVLERALRASGPAEMEWLYGRALNQLRNNSTDRELRTIVLQLGRLSYGRKRPDRRLTIYDEQAIANDISAATL